MADELNVFVPLEEIESAFLNQLQQGGLHARWISRPWVASSGGTNLVVGPSAGLLLNGVRLPAKDETVVSPGTLTADTWYYVYAYNSAGVITYEVSTTPPDIHLRFKSTDTSRVFVRSFRTFNDTTVKICAFRAVGNRYLYRIGQNFSAGLQTQLVPLSDGNATGATLVECSNGVPPHCRIAILELVVERTAGSGGATADLFVNGDEGTGIPQFRVHARDEAGGFERGVFEMELDDDQQIRYLVSTANIRASINIRGFVENLPL